jgi:hypothetical protein
METEIFEFDLAHAYLEMARAHHGTPVIADSGTDSADKRITNNTVLALDAHGYIFSFMALNAFVSGALWRVWEVPNSPLKLKYPQANSFKHLLKTHLRELKMCISDSPSTSNCRRCTSLIRSSGTSCFKF